MTVVLSPRRRALAYAMGGFGLAMNAMIQFLLPLRAAELGIGIGVIGLLLGTKAFTEAVVSIPVGNLMDRIGARGAFILGAAGSAIIAMGYYFATTLFWLFVLQVLLGVVRPLGWIGGQSYVAGLRTGEERAHDTGRFSFAANLAQIIAPLLVGVASESLGLQMSFTVMAIYSALFILLGIALPDAGRHESTSGKSSVGVMKAVKLLELRGIRVAMLLTFARLFIPATWTSFFPLYLVTSGLPESQAGAVLSMMGLTAMVVALLSGRIARLGTPEIVTAVGLGASALGVALSPVLDTGLLPFVAAFLVGLGQGISLPMLITIVSNAAPPDQRGLALGLRSTVNQVSSTVAPVLIAPIIGVGGVIVGFPVAGGIIVSALLGAVFLHTRRPVEAATSHEPD